MHAFEFRRDHDASGTTLVVLWVYPDGEETLSLAAIADELTSSGMVGMADPFGTPVKLETQQIHLDHRPLDLQIRRQ